MKNRILIEIFVAWTSLAYFDHSAFGQSYVGPNRCKICHKKQDLGDQYGIWLKTKHHKAYESLGTAEAKEKAKALGVDDPQNSEHCLICHTTAFEAADSKMNVNGVRPFRCTLPASSLVFSTADGLRPTPFIPLNRGPSLG